MKRTNLHIAMLCLLILALCVPAAQAQQKDKDKDPRLNPPVQPVSAIGGEESSSRAAGAAAPASQAPVSAPLNGAQEWTPGGSGAGTNFFVPSLSLYFGGDSNSRGGNSGISSVTTFGTKMALQRVWRTSQFVVDYGGGASFYSTGTNSSRSRNRSHQDLRLSYQKAFRTWSFQVADSVNYSPEGGFGRRGGYGQLGLNQGGWFNGLVNLNPLLVPNNSILTTDSGRVSNTVVGDVSYTPNPRSTVTFGGSFGVLKFLDDGFIDSHDIGARVGYDYQVSARDTLGVSYQHSRFEFSGTSHQNTSHSTHLSYGRRISGRLTIQVSGGPQYTVVNPVLGNSRKLLRWSTASSLTYRLNQGGIHLGYVHAATGGSGFFLGAVSDQVTAGFSHQFTRQWRGSFSTSFARNEALADATGIVTGRRFYSVAGRANLSRPVGRYTTMSLSYSVQHQNSTNVSCTVPSCAFTGIRHVFGIGFNFRVSPIELE